MRATKVAATPRYRRMILGSPMAHLPERYSAVSAARRNELVHTRVRIFIAPRSEIRGAPMADSRRPKALAMSGGSLGSGCCALDRPTRRAAASGAANHRLLGDDG